MSLFFFSNLYDYVYEHQFKYSLPSNKLLVHVVYIVHVHICESISSHDVDNFMKKTLITCIMIIQVLLYTGSSRTDKLTYICLKKTHFNEQRMLLDFEIFKLIKVL